jgi:hypothetical protein
MKTCPCCQRTLEASAFSKCIGQSDGLYHSCKECSAKKRKAYYEANKEKIAAAKKERRATKEYREKINGARKIERAENPEKIRAADRRRYEKTKQRILELQKGYYRQNREEILKRGEEKRRQYMKAAIEQLKPGYVKALLLQGTELKRKDIPEQLVKAKTLQLLILRTAKELNDEKR